MVCFRFRFKSSFQKFMVISITGLVSACGGGGGREQDMLAGLLVGKSNKEIARKHGLSEVTVKHHLKSLRGKLGAKNRTHAVCRAIELGIVLE